MASSYIIPTDFTEHVAELLEHLKPLGMGEYHSRVFVALLALHRANLAKIARKAKLNHVIAREKLQDLINIGLIYDSNVKNSRIFFLTPPRLGIRIKSQGFDVNHTQDESAMFECLSGLEIIYGDQESHSKIHCVTTDTPATPLARLIKKTQPERVAELSSRLDLIKAIRHAIADTPTRIRGRGKETIEYQLISTGDPKTLKTRRNAPKSHITHNIPNDKTNFSGDICVFGKFVSLLSDTLSSSGDPMMILLRDPKIALTIQALFELSMIGLKHQK